MSGFLALGSLMTPAMMAPAVADSSDATTLRQGLPGRRISGGSRAPDTACLTTPDQPVIALVPKHNVSETLAERPTFWVAVPAVNSNRTLEFGLFDSAGTLIHQKNIQPSGQAGLVSLTLPETMAPLQVDQNYRWYFSVVCNSQSRAEDLSVTSWVRRVEADSELAEQLAVSNLQAQLALYQASEFWYDALTAIASLQQAEMAQQSLQQPTSSQAASPPSTTQQQWRELLAAIELTDVISSPLADLLAVSVM